MPTPYYIIFKSVSQVQSRFHQQESTILIFPNFYSIFKIPYYVHHINSCSISSPNTVQVSSTKGQSFPFFHFFRQPIQCPEYVQVQRSKVVSQRSKNLRPIQEWRPPPHHHCWLNPGPAPQHIEKRHS